MPAAELNRFFDELETAGLSRKLPPIERWKPAHFGTIDIRIAADGTWYHEGTAFRRPALVRLLASVLMRDGDDYFLVSPHEKLKILVEDVPLLATDFEVRGTGCSQELLFTTNGGDHVIADTSHQLFLRGDRPYIHVRSGLEALIIRSAFYRLLDLGEVDDRCFRLWSRGSAFELPLDA